VDGEGLAVVPGLLVTLRPSDPAKRCV